MATVIESAPAVEPVSLAEAKSHLRVDISDDDTYITALIVAARMRAEAEQNRALITQTWDLYCDRFPVSAYRPILIPLPPTQSISYIKYYDTAGTLQTWDDANYQTDTGSVLARILPEPSGSWPTTETDRMNAVNVQFIAGYGDASTDVPQETIAAILLIVGTLYENREDVVVGTIVSRFPNYIYDMLRHNAIPEFA